MVDYTKEEVVALTGEFYRLCYEQARRLYRDEQAVQSATATILINATKEYSPCKSWSDALRKKIAELDKERAIPSVLDVWYFHYSDLIAKYGARMKGMIEHCVTERSYSPQELDEHIQDYATRLSKELNED